MLIDEFVKRMSARFPTQLSTDLKVGEFRKSCNDYLKPWAGEVLGFVFEEFNCTVNSRTHPVMPAILDMCKKKAHEQQTVNSVPTKQPDYLATALMVNEFKKTLEFQKCAEQLTAMAAIRFIQKNKKFPNESDIQHFIKVRDGFLRDMREQMNNPSARMAGWGRTLYETGCYVYLNDVSLMRTTKGLNDISLDYQQVTFEEHKNRDMDYPEPVKLFTDQKLFA